MDERQLHQQFIAEAGDLVESLYNDLNRLTDQKASGRVEPSLVNHLFRSAHSLKGLAGLAGLPAIQEAAHRFEDLLDALRMGRLAIDDGAVACCARIAECIEGMVSAAAHHEAHEELAERVALMVDGLRESAAASERGASWQYIALDERVQRTLTEYEQHRVQENLHERRPIVEVRVAFDLVDFDARFRELTGRLATVGEVISNLPGMADDPMKIAFRVLYATDEPLPGVEAVVGEYDGTVQVLTEYPEQAERAEPEKVDGREMLRPVSTFVRVDVRALNDLAVLAEELAIKAAELARVNGELAERLGVAPRELFDLKQRTRSLDRGFLELEERLVAMRLVPLVRTFARARRLVSKVAGQVGREVALEVRGEDVQLDKAIVDRISEPLAHLLRNAVDHGIEAPDTREAAGKPRAGRIVLAAESRGNRVALIVSDDGAGIDEAAFARDGEPGLDAIFRPGVTTARAVSQISGRGVGLDAVAVAAAELGGEISVETTLGAGSSFTITLPSTLVMISAFLVEAAGEPYAIDVNQLSQIGAFDAGDLAVDGAVPTIGWRGARIPFHQLSALVGAPSTPAPHGGSYNCLVARIGDEQAAIAVDRFVGGREVIVKSLGRHASRLGGVSGAVDLEGGRIALLLDLPGLLTGRAI